MNELTRGLRAFAAESRVDLLGVAPIERFEEVPAEHHPRTVFPEVRSVVVVGKRITRGTLRGVEEGTQFDLYAQYGQSWLADRMLAITTIGVATWLEDSRWEAVPVQDLPPEVPPSGVRVRPDLPPPNVMVDVREAAVRAGLGEVGWCGELLTPQFGPRQRLQLILTDAPLEPTSLLTEPVCDHCRECAAACPLGAFGGGERTVSVCGREMAVADVDFAACRRCQNGARPNPHHTAGRPDRLGALCVRTCVHHLEAAGRVSNTFAHPFRQRPAWQVDASGASSLQAEPRGEVTWRRR
jgi:epoxyqueuosine reductase